MLVADHISPLVIPRPMSGTQRLDVLVATHIDTVWRTLKRLGVEPGSVDDATQRVFMVAASKLDIIEPRGERAYLLGIAVRVASELRRTHARTWVREVPDGGAAADAWPSDVSIEDLVDEKRAVEVLTRALDRLSPDLRETFVLFELEELGAPEVAALLGISEGTVASRVRRAREHIRAALERWARKERR